MAIAFPCMIIWVDFQVRFESNSPLFAAFKIYENLQSIANRRDYDVIIIGGGM
jgi:hypothetical protein